MQWFYPPGDKASGFIERLRRSKLEFAFFGVLYGWLALLWIVDLAVLGDLDEWTYLGSSAIWWLATPLLSIMVGRDHDPKPWKPLEAAAWIALFGAFIGVVAAWRADAPWPLWPAAAVWTAAILPVPTMAFVSWARRKNPYRAATPDT